MRTLGKTYQLSTQQVISCDHHDNGCNGGNTESAYKYLEESDGHVLASDYARRPRIEHGTFTAAAVPR